MTITVHVTDLHLVAGTPCNCACCPVALALAEATGRDWIVDGSRAWLRGKPERKVILPRRVGEKVRRLDLGRRVRPFSFALEVPE